MATLPFDLLQEILEASADGGVSQAAALATVSHDFYDIVHPVLCRSLSYSPKRQWPVPHQDLSPWLELNGKYVRNVKWAFSELEALPDILQKCPNITNLAVWNVGAGKDLHFLLALLPSLHLSRLSVGLDRLFGSDKFLENQALSDGFKGITHLDTFQVFLKWDDIAGIAYLPNLTHLSLLMKLTRARPIPIVDAALRQCESLKVLVVVKGRIRCDISRSNEGVHVFQAGDRSESQKLDDIRLVVMERDYSVDWDLDVIRGRGMWVIADQLVAKRLAEAKDRENIRGERK